MAAPVAFRIGGLRKVTGGINRAGHAFKRSSKSALWQFMLRVERTAVQLTPRDKGNLRDTRETEIISTSNGYVAIIRYTADYAIYVHEILENRHPIGQAKFLEEALKRHLGEGAVVLGKGIRLR